MAKDWGEKGAVGQQSASHLLAGKHRLRLPQLQGSDGGRLHHGECHRWLLVVLGSLGHDRRWSLNHRQGRLQARRAQN